MNSQPDMDREHVWVFNGDKNHFPSGVFRSREEAEAWIQRHNLAGTLTQYPVGVGVYEWAVESGSFAPKHQKHRSPEFIANFSTAAQQHYHYEARHE
jgi:hypothetical protein